MGLSQARAALAVSMAGPMFIAAVAVAENASAEPHWLRAMYGSGSVERPTEKLDTTFSGTCVKAGDTIRFTGTATDTGDAATNVFSGTATCGPAGSFVQNQVYSPIVPWWDTGPATAIR